MIARLLRFLRYGPGGAPTGAGHAVARDLVATTARAHALRRQVKRRLATGNPYADAAADRERQP